MKARKTADWIARSWRPTIVAACDGEASVDPCAISEITPADGSVRVVRVK